MARCNPSQRATGQTLLCNCNARCSAAIGTRATAVQAPGPGIAISAGTLAFGPIGSNQPAAEADADSNNGFASGLLQRIGFTRKPASLVQYRGDPARWTKKARAARGSVASDMYRALLPAIRTAPDSTVVTIVGFVYIAGFQSAVAQMGF